MLLKKMKSIGFVAVEKSTGELYTGGRYKSGAKVFRTAGLARGAIKQHTNETVASWTINKFLISEYTTVQPNKDKQYEIKEVFIND